MRPRTTRSIRLGETTLTTAAATTATVQLRDVHKAYALGARRVPALRGVDLEITESGFYAIMGPSGSGKSTLLHLLAALDRPDRGEITVAGERIDRLDEGRLTDFRRRRIGIIFQQFNLVSTLTAVENVALPGMLDGMDKAKRRSRAMELLETLGLQERAEHKPDALSGGEQQRVAIARALFFQPTILFADEPTGALDTATGDRLFELLVRLAEQHHMTVLMVTHEPSAAVHCEHVYVLQDGMIADSFDVEGLDASELATRAQHARR